MKQTGLAAGVLLEPMWLEPWEREACSPKEGKKK